MSNDGPHDDFVQPTSGRQRSKRQPRDLVFACPKGVAPDSKEAHLNRATRRALQRKKGQACQEVRRRLQKDADPVPPKHQHQKTAAEALPVKTRRKAG